MYISHNMVFMYYPTKRFNIFFSASYSVIYIKFLIFLLWKMIFCLLFRYKCATTL